MTELDDTERATLLEPCVCGHTINDHGSLVACWLCEEGGDRCGTDFEALLCQRVAVIVSRRMESRPIAEPEREQMA